MDNLGLEMVQAVQGWRGPFWDLFFRGWALADSPIFFYVLIPCIWFMKGQRVGLRFMALVVLVNFSVDVLKDVFHVPRPCQIMPNLAMIPVGSYSFPSGGATTAMLLSALLLYYGKGWIKWPIAIVFFSCLSFSRVYLGVHYPLDILGGWVVGGAMWALCVWIFPYIEKWINGWSYGKRLIGVVLVLSILCFIDWPKIVLLSCIALGMSLGAVLVIKNRLDFTKPRTWSRKICYAFIGVVIAGIGKELSVFEHYQPLQGVLLGVAVSLGGAWVIHWIVRRFG